MASGKHSAKSKYSFDTNYNFSQNDYESKYDKDDYEDDGLDRKKVISIFFIVIAIIVVCVMIGINNKNEETNTVNSNTVTNGLIEEYKGYDVLGKIIIDEFEVEQYILDSTEDEALNNGVIKLYGGSLNNYGNFCIAGHNKSGVFEKLAEMEVGDLFKVIEPDLKETNYKITEIYSVEADDLKCLLQNDEKIEITLITCENASTTRLIVKAEEV